MPANRFIAFFVLLASSCSQLDSSAPLLEYRSADGAANNKAHPNWGRSHTTYKRLIKKKRKDFGLPNARSLSRKLLKQEGAQPDERGLNALIVFWGQFLDHDVSLTPVNESDRSMISVLDPNDPIGKRIPFKSSIRKTFKGDYFQMNHATPVVDASMVYGHTAKRAKEIRSGKGGSLTLGHDQLLPRNIRDSDNANEGPLPNAQLHLAGDIRANENVMLLFLHTMFVWEHNRLAALYQKKYPNWSDEELYQKARALVGGMIQAITYNEYLPSLLGKAWPYRTEQFAYSSATDPVLFNEFPSVFFRLGHSQIPDKAIKLYADNQKEEFPLHQLFFNPSLIKQKSSFMPFIRGVLIQKAEKIDMKIVDQLRNFLFFFNKMGVGLDLAALNIQRGRDHEIADYNSLRRYFGLKAVPNFASLFVDQNLAAEAKSLYGSIANLDAWVGALSEPHLPDSSVGPLLARALNKQFKALAEGDRFFYRWSPSLTVKEREWVHGVRLLEIIRRYFPLHPVCKRAFFVN